MSKEPAGRDHRRQEARAIPWGELIPQHRTAVRRVLELLQSAVNALPTPQREPPHDPMSVASALRVRPDRTSQLAFIDGGRGTGKTSVELSLREALLSETGLERMSEERGSSAIREEIKALARIARDIRPRLEWLFPLDMEPLPAGVNVLAAILVRIEQALRDIDARKDSSGGWLARSDHSDDLMTTLDNLRTDVVHAWDGGMRERSPGQNLHAWSQEVLDAERARLNLAERFAFLLDRIAWHRHQRRGGNPLFVLVVDDFDLSPNHCVDLLRVVRMISTPRLFFIFAGHLDMARDVMHLKSAGDASTLAGSAGRLASCASRVEQMASAVAANNLRKLVPPTHRIELGPLAADEISQVYLSASEKGQPVRFVEKLKQWRFRLGDARSTMADLFLGPWVGEAPASGEDISKLRYFQSFLHTPIRTLVDTDMALSGLVWDHETPEARSLIDLITRELRLRLDELDGQFGADALDALREAVTERRPSRACTLVFDSVPTLWQHSGHAIRYNVAHDPKWMLSSGSHLERGSRVPESLSAGLALLHDLSVDLGNPPDRPFAIEFARRIATLGGIDHPHPGKGEKFNVRHNWPPLSWERIGDALLFLRLWSITLERGLATPERLLHCWLRAWYAVEGKEHSLAFEPFDPSQLDALFASDDLGPIRSDGNHSAALERRLEVTTMLRPELGWDEAFVGPLLKLPALRRFLGRADIAERIRAARASAMKHPSLIRLVSPRAWWQLRTEVGDTLLNMALSLRVGMDLSALTDPIGMWLEFHDRLGTHEELSPDDIEALERRVKRSVETLTRELAR